MTGHKGSRPVVILRFLTALSNGPMLKTHVMYSALSNSADTTRYLDILERGGMVTRETGVYKIQYALTEKGRAFLAKLVELEKEFPEVW